MSCNNKLKFSRPLLDGIFNLTLGSIKVAANDPMATTIDIMREVLVDKFGIEVAMLGEDQTIESLGLDSLTFIEYIFELEKELHIVLPDPPRDLVTIGSLVRFIEGEVSRQASTAAAT